MAAGKDAAIYDRQTMQQLLMAAGTDAAIDDVPDDVVMAHDAAASAIVTTEVSQHQHQAALQQPVSQ